MIEGVAPDFVAVFREPVQEFRGDERAAAQREEGGLRSMMAQERPDAWGQGPARPVVVGEHDRATSLAQLAEARLPTPSR